MRLTFWIKKGTYKYIYFMEVNVPQIILVGSSNQIFKFFMFKIDKKKKLREEKKRKLSLHSKYQEFD